MLYACSARVTLRMGSRRTQRATIEHELDDDALVALSRPLRELDERVADCARQHRENMADEPLRALSLASANVNTYQPPHVRQ